MKKERKKEKYTRRTNRKNINNVDNGLQSVKYKELFVLSKIRLQFHFIPFLLVLSTLWSKLNSMCIRYCCVTFARTKEELGTKIRKGKTR